MCRAHHAKSPLNYRAVAALCLCNIAHFYSICSIFSYAGYLSVDLGWAEDADRAGFVAGLLPTFLIMGRIPTAALWGVAADRFGRRRVLLLSLSSIAAGNIFFGLSRSLWLALTVRCLLLGALNGWTSVMVLLCGELGGDRQADVIGYVFSTGQLLNLVGPALGGFTYGVGFGPTFPALLPSLLGVGVAMVAFTATALYLPETSKSLLARQESQRRQRASEHRSEAERGQLEADQMLAQQTSSTHSTHAREHETGAGGPPEAAEAAAEAKEADAPLCSVLCRRPLPLVATLRAAQGMTMFAVFDMVPLWAIASLRAGGLALGEEQLGMMLTAAGAGSLLFTSTFIGPCVRRLGARSALVVGSVVAGIAIVFIPLVRAPFIPSTAAMLLSALLLSINSASILCAASGVLAASNNILASLPNVGTVQGVLATVEGIGKMLGPAAVAPLLAFCISSRPLEQTSLITSGAFFTFLGLAAVLWVLALGGAMLPKAVDSKSGEPAQQANDSADHNAKQAGVQPSVSWKPHASSVKGQIQPNGPHSQRVAQLLMAKTQPTSFLNTVNIHKGQAAAKRRRFLQMSDAVELQTSTTMQPDSCLHSNSHSHV